MVPTREPIIVEFEDELIDITDMNGEELARQFCVNCHVFTEPELLPKDSWNFLLTYMGLRLGIDDDSYLGEMSPVEEQVMETRRTLLAEEGLIPPVPVMPDESWRKLRQYYEKEAPRKAIQPRKPSIKGTASIFREKAHDYDFRGAVTSMVHIDPDRHQLLVGDSLNQRFSMLDKDLKHMISYPTTNAFWVDAIPTSSGVFLLSVGDIAGAFVKQRLGKIAYGRRIGDRTYETEGFVLKNLYRPSDMELADMNNDGIAEMLVCSFGDEGGDFSIYQWDNSIPGFSETPQVTLYEETGPIKCATHDFNGDGLLDIVLIVSDVKEHMSLFLNKGDGSYEKKVLLEVHPSWGYIGLQLVDLNKDGHMDILTANGDNMDADPYNTLKRYHGIRAYLNDGRMNFSEEFFYPMPGAYQVHAHDYDMDGDIDIAASSFFPDFNSMPLENFIYLEQTRSMKFTPRRHPATELGRWMTMDAGDLDGDGDVDIVLGAAYSPIGMEEKHPELLKEFVENGKPLLVLENTTR